MSSTNRGGDRHVSDYYVTPIPVVEQFLQRFFELEPEAFKGRILDPCAGGDSAHLMSYPTALINCGVAPSQISTADMREDSPAEHTGDYLTMNLGSFDMVITNPPFFLAKEITDKALADIVSGGFVVMLLRLNFFGGKKRKSWWLENMPKYSFVHSKRISFTDDGKTDSIEYMHCVWQKGLENQSTMLYIL